MINKSILLLALLSLSLVSESFCQSVDTTTAKALYPRFSRNKKLILAGQGNKYAFQLTPQIQSIAAQNGWDGVVFRIPWPGGGYDDIFDTSLVNECSLGLDTLRNINWNDTLTDNFIRFTAARSITVDWFDTTNTRWDVIKNNLHKISYAVSESGAKGIFLDVEPYSNTTWRYSSSLYPNKTLAEVQAQVKQRGYQFIKELQKYDEDIVVFLIPGAFTYGGAGSSYELLKSFSDGILLGINDKARLIEGNEISYYNHTTQQWMYNPNAYGKASNSIAGSSLPDKAKYSVEVAQATRYTDSYYYDSVGDNNKLLEHHIYMSLLMSDRYSWFFGELTQDSLLWNQPLPLLTKKAIDSAKYKYNNNLSLGFTVKQPSGTYIFTYSNDLVINSPSTDDTFSVGDTLIITPNYNPSVTHITYFVSNRKNGLDYSSSTSYKLRLNDTGLYQVVGYSYSWGKVSNIVTFYVTANTGLKPGKTGLNKKAEVNNINYYNENINNIQVYPNPTNNEINFINNDNSCQIVHIYIYNSKGILIEDYTNPQGNIVTLNTQSYLPSVYYYKVILSNNQEESGKFIKK